MYSYVSLQYLYVNLYVYATLILKRWLHFVFKCQMPKCYISITFLKKKKGMFPIHLFVSYVRQLCIYRAEICIALRNSIYKPVYWSVFTTSVTPLENSISTIRSLNLKITHCGSILDIVLLLTSLVFVQLAIPFISLTSNC